MENAALYRAVIEHPDSDAPREQYARWLAENAQSDRAEFIRLQLEDARTPPAEDPDAPDEEWERRQARIRVLLMAHPEWREFPQLAGIGWGHGTNHGFKRGFLDSVLVTGSGAFVSGMGRVFELAPVTRAFVEKVDDAGVAAIAQSPFLARLRTLQLDFSPISDAGAEALAASPHAARLRLLRFYRCRVGRKGALALAASPHLPADLELDLRGNPVDAGGVEALRQRFAEKVLVDSPDEGARNPLLGPFDGKLVACFQKLTGALSAAPPRTTAIECNVRPLPGQGTDGFHTQVAHVVDGQRSLVQVRPEVRQAAGELVSFWKAEGGGFPGVRATMTRQRDGTWQVNIVRLDSRAAGTSPSPREGSEKPRWKRR